MFPYTSTGKQDDSSMRFNIQGITARSVCNTVSEVGKKLTLGALAWSFLNCLSVSPVGLGAITAVSIGTYLTYKGVQELSKESHPKGNVKTLIGMGMVIGGGLLASVASKTVGVFEKFPGNAVAADETSRKMMSYDSLAIHASNFTRLGMAVGAWVVANMGRNDGHIPYSCPTFERRLETIKTKGKEFGREIAKALENGAKLTRLRSFSGVYLIKDAQGKSIALFKPDEERHLGPSNPGCPGTRAADPTDEDIVHKELGAHEQRSPSKRQNLAKLLDHETISPLPRGLIAEIESDCFVDSEAEKTGKPPQIQNKSGYLQEWVENSEGSLFATHPETVKFLAATPEAEPPPEFYTRFHDHPLLDKIPLEEFQKICIMNIRLYNQDGHGGNYLITKDDKGNPHLVPIDMDAILPWQLSGLIGISSHPRAREPFTQAALDHIDQFDSDDVRKLTENMHLSEHAGINAKALTIVLQEFSRAGLTLADIHHFICKAPHEDTSQLWHLMLKAKKNAVESLPPDDRGRFQYMEFIRREIWLDGGKNAPQDAEKHLSMHRLNDEKRVNEAVDANFWPNFKRLLRRLIRERLN